MAKKFLSINLLGNKKNDFLDKFISWALTIGRGLVVLTELIALTAFIYRFSLDREIIDLHSKIKQKQAMVNHLRSNEDKFRNLQERIGLIHDFSDSSQKRVKMLKDIIALAPQDISFNTINYNKNTLSINASVTSSSSLRTFVNSLKKYPIIKSLSLDSIENRPASTLITVSITALLETYETKQ